MVLISLATAGCARNLPATSTPPAASSPQALQLKLPLYPSGAMHDLAEDRGSVVLVDVWATWCEPCKAALPLYQGLERKYGSQGLKVYAINIDEDGQQIPPFLKTHNLDLPVLLDTGGKFAEDTLRVLAMPTTLLLDRTGVIRFRHDGFNQLAASRYESELQTLLAEGPK